MSRLNTAIELARRGFKLFPIQAGKKFPPLLSNWPQRATSDERLIAAQWGPNGTPDANLGLHCDGLVVIDVDAKKGGVESFNRIDMLLDFPSTLKHRTPSGGWHVFYSLPAGHPGVPNSVEDLGKGLDIRSTNGYVVAPGSATEAGEYTVAFDRDIAPAPAWLLRRLGQTRPKAPTADVPDAPDASVERAREWLQGAERSVKGQGGDQAAFRVACRLRDLGMSYDQACELMRSEAWDHGCGWRDGWLEDKPIRSAYTYAQNEDGGGRGVVEDDLPLPVSATAETAPPVKKKRSRVVRADDFAKEEGNGPGYVIKRLLPRASYTVAYGPPAIGKSFLFLDIGYHVAHSKPWMGLLVRGGPVLYLAFEGIGGLKLRARALQKKYGEDLGPLYIVGANMNLRELAGRQELGAIMAEMPEKPVLIIIDTFARALKGGDENSAQDVGALHDAIAGLVGHTGACVLFVHHTGKNKAAGARGSSAIQGAVDTEIEIEMGFIKSTKQRDNECLPPIAFKLRPVTIGIDIDGEEETSCVVEPSTAAQALMKKPLTGKAEHAFNILSELTGLDNTPVARVRWTGKMIDEGFSKSTAHEWVRKLAHRGYAMLEDDYVRRMLK